MKPEETDDLILGHLEARSTDEERRRLDEALSTDPEAGRRYAELALQEGLLRDLAEAEELGAAASDVKGSSSTRIRRVRAFRRRRHSSVPHWWLWAAAAAVFVLIVGLVSSRESRNRRSPEVAAPMQAPEVSPEELAPVPEAPRQPPVAPPPPAAERILPPLTPAAAPVPAPPAAPPSPPPPKPVGETVPAPRSEPAVARLERVEGTAEMITAGPRSPARAGQALLADQGLEVRDGLVLLRFADETEVQIGRNTAITRITGIPSKRIELARGLLTAKVVKQPPGQPMVLETPTAEVKVLGTTFLLAATPTASRVEVSEGRVRMTRLSDGASVDVSAARYAVATAGQSLAVRTLPEGRVVFTDGFNASTFGQWPRGWDKHPRDAATRSGFVVVTEAGKPADRFIACPTAPDGTTQHAFVPLADWGNSFTMTFRMRVPGGRNDRAGVEFDDGRLDPSFQYDSKASMLEVDWPRGTVLKQTPLKLLPDTWTDWKISVDGPRFTVFVEGKLLLELDVAGYGTAKGVSLVSRGSDTAHFDDVQVSRRPR